jgi:hypothetical protein
MGMQHYFFRKGHCPELDCHLYEIQRSEGEIPFTVVVENFSTVGHRQFFSDIFVSKEWDVGRSVECSIDCAFLKEMWGRLGLKEEYGPFTPFYISHPPNPISKPRVYRKPLEQVWGKLIDVHPEVIEKLTFVKL